jgi:hypothetical protein
LSLLTDGSFSTSIGSNTETLISTINNFRYCKAEAPEVEPLVPRCTVKAKKNNKVHIDNVKDKNFDRYLHEVPPDKVRHVNKGTHYFFFSKTGPLIIMN